jgi:hypothetical protein
MRRSLVALLLLVPFVASCLSYQRASDGHESWSIGIGGATGIWILANISYAGMRAQASRSAGWRALAFIFGLPGTIVSLLAVVEGSSRAYGVILPRGEDQAPADRREPPGPPVP